MLLFFKIKQFHELKDISSAYEDFDYWDGRVRTILNSFVDFPINFIDDDPWRCIPRSIAENYSEFQEQVLVDSIEWAKGLMNDPEDFVKIQNFFQNEFHGRVLEEMDFEIKTPSGTEEISLSFAENFRFKSNSGFFNIFTIPKASRDIIVPQDQDSIIFAADFRQFEFRTFLKLQGLDDILKSDDIYATIGKELNMGDNPKVSILAYLYNDKDDRKLESFFKKKDLLSRVDDNNIFWSDEGPVYIPGDHENKKKVHTIIQTVSQYVYLKKLDKILQVLHNKRSQFLFPLHDSVILSLRKDEPEVLESVMDILEDETYKIKCYMGPNFRDAVEI